MVYQHDETVENAVHHRHTRTITQKVSSPVSTGLIPTVDMILNRRVGQLTRYSKLGNIVGQVVEVAVSRAMLDD